MFEFWKELLEFFIPHKFQLSNRLTNMHCLSRIAYLADVFVKLNESCLSLQEKVNFFQTKDKMLLYKLQYWISAVKLNAFVF